MPEFFKRIFFPRAVFFVALVTLFFHHSLSADQQIVERVEPPSWWVGMQHSSVQLMVHGKNIAALVPQTTANGVRVAGTETTDNPNYLFITLEIGDAAKPGKVQIDLLENNIRKAGFDYQLAAREPGSAQRKGFNNSDAIYLITPDRFANALTENDSLPQLKENADRNNKGGRHGGDIEGMIRQLDYVAGMGFTQIWPNPLLENDQPAYSYHGYAATDLYLIDERFGSNEDFRRFVQEARQRGVGVIKDIILNHIGSEHWWMKDMPASDWLNQHDTYLETNHRRTTLQDPYAAPSDKNAFVNGWFSRGMPDLNQQHPLLATYLIQHSIWWTEYAGLSGIREDTYGYADEKFLTRWGKALMTEYPNFSIVGEEWSNNPLMIAQWQRGYTNANGHVSHVNSMMDFPLYEALRSSLLNEESWDKGWIELYEALANDHLYPDPYELVIFPENHDTSRLFSYLHEDKNLYRSAMIWLATMRGIPQFYYGAEILMTSPRERDDGAVRADMPGGWAGDRKNAFTGEGLTTAEKEMQSLVKKLFNWRKSNPVIHTGKLMHFAPDQGTYVYFRYDDSKTVMVVLNKNKENQKLETNRFAEFTGKVNKARNVLTGEVVDIRKSVNLPAGQSLVLEW